MDFNPSRKVAILSWGGTILRGGSDRLDHAYFERVVSETGAQFTLEDLVASVPEIREVADVELVQGESPQGIEVDPENWLRLRSLVLKIIRDLNPLDGLVITHGTGTLEETAYFLSLTLPSEIPIVIVGSVMPLNALGSDAGRNLLAAVRVAASQEAKGRGTLVVVNEEIHAPRDVEKRSTHKLEAFSSGRFGQLGSVEADRIMFYRDDVRIQDKRIFELDTVLHLPRVDVAYSYAGSDGCAISAFVENRAKAIVCAGFAPGRVTPMESQAITAAISKGVLVVLTSRSGDGRVIPRDQTRSMGIVTADNLSPQKARVLSMVALTSTTAPEEIQTMFDRC